MRCVHEASLHDENCFLTLTYDDEHLPPNGSLDKKAFPRFIKRLRRHLDRKYKVPPKIKYFHAGEYGSETNRPHYHAILFNYNFPDKVLYSVRGEYQVYTSDTLDSLWKCGRCEIGSVTFESAGYVARYIMAKVTGPIADEYYDGLEPEFATMSRRPAIGKGWFEKWGNEVFPHDAVIMRGKPMKPPKYYETLKEQVDPEGLQLIKNKRERARRRRSEGPSLESMETVTIARTNLFTKRGE